MNLHEVTMELANTLRGDTLEWHIEKHVPPAKAAVVGYADLEACHVAEVGATVGHCEERMRLIRLAESVSGRDRNLHGPVVTTPRFRLGEFVMVNAGPRPLAGAIAAIRAEVSYTIQGSNEWFHEDLLGTTATCAPDGTRCGWFLENLRLHSGRYDGTEGWPFCPGCRGKLWKE